jgi:hypothetical protein
MNSEKAYYLKDELENEGYVNEYPWVEFSINGTKLDINSKYIYGSYYYGE